MGHFEEVLDLSLLLFPLLVLTTLFCCCGHPFENELTFDNFLEETFLFLSLKLFSGLFRVVKIVKFGIAYMKFHAKQMLEDLAKYDVIKMEVVGRANLNEWMGQYTPQIFISNYQVEDGTLGF